MLVLVCLIIDSKDTGNQKTDASVDDDSAVAISSSTGSQSASASSSSSIGPDGPEAIAETTSDGESRKS